MFVCRIQKRLSNDGKIKTTGPTAWWLFVILIAAAFLRFRHLDTQSLWLDELHTMIESDPAEGWAHLFRFLGCCDQHPPLFFVIERLAFTVFGHTSFVARCVSALAGIGAVWGTYLLGRELGNKRTGLIAAALLCVNPFAIWHAQDARGYSLLLLITAFSFLLLVRFLKNPGNRAAMLYALSALLLLYTHYYGLFLLVAQGLIAGIVTLASANRKPLILGYARAALVIFVGYFPWLPYLAGVGAIRSFWIPPVESDFVIDFFKEYFGLNESLLFFLCLLLVFYVLLVLQSLHTNTAGNRDIRTRPVLLAFVVLVTWVAVALYLPYLRSLLSTPMLISRYTIAVIPALVIAMAMGLDVIRWAIFRWALACGLLLFSAYYLVFESPYYNSIQKTQFREMTALISQEGFDGMPVINEKTAWHQQYYLDLFNNTNEVKTGPKDSLMASLLRDSLSPVAGFWVVGAHNDPKPLPQTVAQVSGRFSLLNETDFYDAWAMFFMDKTAPVYTLERDSVFPVESFIELDGKHVLPIWERTVTSRSLFLEPGDYTVFLVSKGTPSRGVFPRVNVYWGNEKIGWYDESAYPTVHTFRINVQEGSAAPVAIEMENDHLDVITGEDRNVFVLHLLVQKTQ